MCCVYSFRIKFDIQLFNCLLFEWQLWSWSNLLTCIETFNSNGNCSPTIYTMKLQSCHYWLTEFRQWLSQQHWLWTKSTNMHWKFYGNEKPLCTNTHSHSRSTTFRNHRLYLKIPFASHHTFFSRACGKVYCELNFVRIQKFPWNTILWWANIAKPKFE